MTFIYRQLCGVRKEFNTSVLCSRISENLEIFPHDKLYFYPQDKFAVNLSRLKEIILNRPELSYLNIPHLFFYKKKQYEKFISGKESKLIHAHFGPSGIEVLPIAQKLNLPLLTSFHGYDASSLLKYSMYIKNLKKLFNYSHVITPSEYMLNSFHKLGLYSKNEHIIHYGIPINIFAYKERQPINQKVIKKEEIIFLQVSNFVEKKGHKYTVITFSNFLKTYPDSRLILAGDGPLRKSIMSLVNDLGIGDKVVFSGLVYQEKVIDLMYLADVFLHHSITSDDGNMEGIPNVIMEAMATGLPIISTRHAAIPELVNHGLNGFLVEEKNIKDYEMAMKKVLSCNNDLGINGRKKIENDFNLDKINEKLISVYKKVLK